MPNFIHKPVLVEEVLAALHPEDGGQYVDGTVGGAGHAAAILEACSPTGRLIGYDRDGTALEAAASRLSPFAGRFELRRGNFAQMAAEIPEGSCAGVLLDLGVSSPMLDCPERGLSFQQDGPLDMRMDQRQELTAAQLVNELPADELANILWELGDEQNSRRIARAIEQNRRAKPFERTSELASLIERVSPRGGRKAHVSTLYRWSDAGCKGIRLEAIQIGGTRCTSAEALQRFFSALTAQATPGALPGPRSTAARDRAYKQAVRDLEREGA